MGLQKTLRALADPIRREILDLLRSGRMSAGEITERFDVTAAAISRHLSVLREADLIRDTREGKFIYYDLNASVLEEIFTGSPRTSAMICIMRGFFAGMPPDATTESISIPPSVIRSTMARVPKAQASSIPL